MMKSISTALTGAFVMATLAFCGCMKNPFAGVDQEKVENKNSAVPVEVTAIQRGAIESTIQASHFLEAEEEVKIFARTSNRVTKLLVEEGDSVAKDQLLVQLDDDTQRTQFNKAQARYDKAKEEYERQKPLYDQNLISEQVFKDAQFELRQLELALEDARRDLDYTEVRAPIAGTITSRLIKYGDLVSVNQHLFDIIDFASIVARVYVPEKELANLSVNQPVRVLTTARKEQVFEGYIQRIAPVVESKTGTVKVTIGFKDTGRLLPGMYVDAEIVTAIRTNAVLIPTRSIVYDGERKFVFRLRNDHTVERIQVQPKISDGANIEPESGFQEGDLVVIAGQSGLKHGTRVRLPDDPDPSPQTAEASEGFVPSE